MPSPDNKDHTTNIAKLHVDLVPIVGNDVLGHELHVTTHSLSMTGMIVMSEHNFRQNLEMHMRLHIPANQAGSAEQYIYVRGKVNYTIYDSGTGAFRSYIRFMSFTNNADKALLAQRLE